MGLYDKRAGGLTDDGRKLAKLAHNGVPTFGTFLLARLKEGFPEILEGVTRGLAGSQKTEAVGALISETGYSKGTIKTVLAYLEEGKCSVKLWGGKSEKKALSLKFADFLPYLAAGKCHQSLINLGLYDKHAGGLTEEGRKLAELADKKDPMFGAILLARLSDAFPEVIERVARGLAGSSKTKMVEALVRETGYPRPTVNNILAYLEDGKCFISVQAYRLAPGMEEQFVLMQVRVMKKQRGDVPKKMLIDAVCDSLGLDRDPVRIAIEELVRKQKVRYSGGGNLYIEPR